MPPKQIFGRPQKREDRYKREYDEILKSIDWSRPFPPPGYRYGVGRGVHQMAAFTTNARGGRSGARTRVIDDRELRMRRGEDYDPENDHYNKIFRTIFNNAEYKPVDQLEMEDAWAEVERMRRLRVRLTAQGLLKGMELEIKDVQSGNFSSEQDKGRMLEELRGAAPVDAKRKVVRGLAGAENDTGTGNANEGTEAIDALIEADNLTSSPETARAEKLERAMTLIEAVREGTIVADNSDDTATRTVRNARLLFLQSGGDKAAVEAFLERQVESSTFAGLAESAEVWRELAFLHLQYGPYSMQTEDLNSTSEWKEGIEGNQFTQSPGKRISFTLSNASNGERSKERREAIVKYWHTPWYLYEHIRDGVARFISRDNSGAPQVSPKMISDAINVTRRALQKRNCPQSAELWSILIALTNSKPEELFQRRDGFLGAQNSAASEDLFAALTAMPGCNQLWSYCLSLYSSSTSGLVSAPGENERVVLLREALSAAGGPSVSANAPILLLLANEILSLGDLPGAKKTILQAIGRPTVDTPLSTLLLAAVFEEDILNSTFAQQPPSAVKCEDEDETTLNRKLRLGWKALLCSGDLELQNFFASREENSSLTCSGFSLNNLHKIVKKVALFHLVHRFRELRARAAKETAAGKGSGRLSTILIRRILDNLWVRTALSIAHSGRTDPMLLSGGAGSIFEQLNLQRLGIGGTGIERNYFLVSTLMLLELLSLRSRNYTEGGSEEGSSFMLTEGWFAGIVKECESADADFTVMRAHLMGTIMEPYALSPPEIAAGTRGQDASLLFYTNLGREGKIGDGKKIFDGVDFAFRIRKRCSMLVSLWMLSLMVMGRTGLRIKCIKEEKFKESEITILLDLSELGEVLRKLRNELTMCLDEVDSAEEEVGCRGDFVLSQLIGKAAVVREKAGDVSLLILELLRNTASLSLSLLSSQCSFLLETDSKLPLVGSHGLPLATKKDIPTVLLSNFSSGAAALFLTLADFFIPEPRSKGFINEDRIELSHVRGAARVAKELLSNFVTFAMDTLSRFSAYFYNELCGLAVLNMAEDALQDPLFRVPCTIDGESSEALLEGAESRYLTALEKASLSNPTKQIVTQKIISQFNRISIEKYLFSHSERLENRMLQDQPAYKILYAEKSIEINTKASDDFNYALKAHISPFLFTIIILNSELRNRLSNSAKGSLVVLAPLMFSVLFGTSESSPALLRAVNKCVERIADSVFFEAFISSSSNNIHVASVAEAAALDKFILPHVVDILHLLSDKDATGGYSVSAASLPLLFSSNLWLRRAHLALYISGGTGSAIPLLTTAVTRRVILDPHLRSMQLEAASLDILRRQIDIKLFGGQTENQSETRKQELEELNSMISGLVSQAQQCSALFPPTTRFEIYQSRLTTHITSNVWNTFINYTGARSLSHESTTENVSATHENTHTKLIQAFYSEQIERGEEIMFENAEALFTKESLNYLKWMLFLQLQTIGDRIFCTIAGQPYVARALRDQILGPFALDRMSLKEVTHNLLYRSSETLEKNIVLQLGECLAIAHLLGARLESSDTVMGSQTWGNIISLCSSFCHDEVAHAIWKVTYGSVGAIGRDLGKLYRALRADVVSNCSLCSSYEDEVDRVARDDGVLILRLLKRGMEELSPCLSRIQAILEHKAEKAETSIGTVEIVRILNSLNIPFIGLFLAFYIESCPCNFDSVLASVKASNLVSRAVFVENSRGAAAAGIVAAQLRGQMDSGVSSGGRSLRFPDVILACSRYMWICGLYGSSITELGKLLTSTGSCDEQYGPAFNNGDVWGLLLVYIEIAASMIIYHARKFVAAVMTDVSKEEYELENRTALADLRLALGNIEVEIVIPLMRAGGIGKKVMELINKTTDEKETSKIHERCTVTLTAVFEPISNVPLNETQREVRQEATDTIFSFLEVVYTTSVAVLHYIDRIQVNAIMNGEIFFMLDGAIKNGLVPLEESKSTLGVLDLTKKNTALYAVVAYAKRELGVFSLLSC